MQFKSYKKVLKSINQKMEIAKLSPIYDKRSESFTTTRTKL